MGGWHSDGVQCGSCHNWYGVAARHFLTSLFNQKIDWLAFLTISGSRGYLRLECIGCTSWLQWRRGGFKHTSSPHPIPGNTKLGILRNSIKLPSSFPPGYIGHSDLKAWGLDTRGGGVSTTRERCEPYYRAVRRPRKALVVCTQNKF